MLDGLVNVLADDVLAKSEKLVVLSGKVKDIVPVGRVSWFDMGSGIMSTLILFALEASFTLSTKLAVVGGLKSGSITCGNLPPGPKEDA